MALFFSIFQQLCFIASLVVVGILLMGRFQFIKRNILLGKPFTVQGDSGSRLRNMVLFAFGQKKMFDRPLVGLMHFVIYAGFLIVNIEVLEIVVDGILGTHRVFSGLLGSSLYPMLLNFFELLALGVVAVCIIFLLRRNVVKLERFQKPELKGWPQSDANIILVWEIYLMAALYTMNATDGVLQMRASESAYLASHYHAVGTFAVSSLLVPLFEGLQTNTLLFIERFAWWMHIWGILGFAIYVTYSKHLHIFLAFPNTYLTSEKPKGEMANMPEITREVKIMMGLEDASQAPQDAPSNFGARDVVHLSQKNLLDAYTCTECGRCTSVCPANQTGKMLSPRKVMMDTRDRVEELGKGIDVHGPAFTDNKTLYGDYITKEEIMACTTCNACVEACPVNINPLDIITQIRRCIAMEDSGTPASWNSMFNNIENNFAPWAFSASDRFNWADELAKGK